MLFDSLLPLILRVVTSLDFFHFIWYRRSTVLPFPLTKLLSLNDVFPSRVRASLRKRCYCDAHRRKFQVLAKHVLKTFMLTLGGVIFWVVSMRASSVYLPASVLYWHSFSHHHHHRKIITWYIVKTHFTFPRCYVIIFRCAIKFKYFSISTNFSEIILTADGDDDEISNLGSSASLSSYIIRSARWCHNIVLPSELSMYAKFRLLVLGLDRFARFDDDI